MRCDLVLCFITVTVLLNNVCCGEEIITKHRSKRQDGPWVWGRYREQLMNENKNSNIMQTSTTPTEKPDPCTPLMIEKPNFSNGRRISEAKCYEYIWELKNRADQAKHDEACAQYREEQGIFTVSAIGGRNTEPGEFPHMGAVGWRAIIGTWIFKCGSSLISTKFLLTAAHCSKVSPGDTTVADTTPEIVRLGDKNILDTNLNGQDPKDVKISRFINHPEYDPPRKYNDIALIEMAEEVYFDKFIQPACLWGYFDTSPLGTKASLTGWGFVDAARQTLSPELQVAFVDIVDSNLCNELLKPAFNRHFWGVQNHQLCAGVLAGGVDSCQGDSGGPLQTKIPLPVTTEGSMSYVIGVTSFGFGCARKNTPGVYTRVSSFIDWIEKNVWP